MPIIFRNNGFTLAEVLIVVALIGILASIASMQYISYRVQSCNAAASTDLLNFRVAMVGHYLDHGYYP